MGLLESFDSVIGASFGLKIDSYTIKGIKDVSGLKLEHDMVEIKTQTADGQYVLRKIPGRAKPVTVTLTRPLTDDTTFEKWMKHVHDGKVPRKDAVITVYDTSMAPVRKYTVKNAQPSSLEITQRAAGANNAVEEKLTLMGETLEIGT